MKKVVVTVKKAFMDRYTGINHKPGEVMKVDESRLREIKRSGDFVTVDKAATEKLNAEKGKAETPADPKK